MGCGDAAKNPSAKSPYYDPLTEAVRARQQETVWKQPGPYSVEASGAMQQAKTTEPVRTMPYAVVNRPKPIIAPPTTVTLTLTEKQANHLRQLLGCVGTNNNEPVISGWGWSKRPAIGDLRNTTDSIFSALTHQGV